MTFSHFIGALFVRSICGEHCCCKNEFCSICFYHQWLYVCLCNFLEIWINFNILHLNSNFNSCAMLPRSDLIGFFFIDFKIMFMVVLIFNFTIPISSYVNIYLLILTCFFVVPNLSESSFYWVVIYLDLNENLFKI